MCLELLITSSSPSAPAPNTRGARGCVGFAGKQRNPYPPLQRQVIIFARAVVGFAYIESKEAGGWREGRRCVRGVGGVTRGRGGGWGVAMQRVLALDRFLSKVDFSNRKKKWSVQRYLLLLAWRRRRRSKSSCLCLYYDTVEGPRARAEEEVEVLGQSHGALISPDESACEIKKNMESKCPSTFCHVKLQYRGLFYNFLISVYGVKLQGRGLLRAS